MFKKGHVFTCPNCKRDMFELKKDVKQGGSIEALDFKGILFQPQLCDEFKCLCDYKYDSLFYTH